MISTAVALVLVAVALATGADAIHASGSVKVTDTVHDPSVFNRSMCVKYADYTNRTLCMTCQDALRVPDCPVPDCPTRAQLADGVDDVKGCDYCRTTMSMILKRVSRRATEYCNICKGFEAQATMALRVATQNPLAEGPKLCSSICTIDACTIPPGQMTYNNTADQCYTATQTYCSNLQ